MRFEILLAIVAAVLVLIWIYRRDRARFERERSCLFDDVRGLLDAAEISRATMEYPRLRGRYQGHAVTIDAVADSMSVRKVPSLWLRVTVLADLPFAGSCDIMARSHNVEFYSPAGSFDHVLKLPAGWPDHLTVKSDDPDASPPRALLDKHVALFEDVLIKEMLITPRGVRLVRQVAQAARAEYLVLRQALFGPVVLPREGLAGLLDHAVALAADLRQAEAGPLAAGAATTLAKVE